MRTVCAEAGTVKLGVVNPGAVGMPRIVKIGTSIDTNIASAVSRPPLLSWPVMMVPALYSGMSFSAITFGGFLSSRNCRYTPRNRTYQFNRVSDTCVVPLLFWVELVMS